MSQEVKNSNIDIIRELFQENRLYQELKTPVALLIDLILRTGATPVDIIHIKPEHFDTATNTILLHPHKKKKLAPSTHQLPAQTVEAFFFMEKTSKPLHSYSIRRLQQLLKEETIRIGSALTNARSLRKEYLKTTLTGTTAKSEHTQLTSIRQRRILTPEEQEKLLTTTYSSRNKTLILTLLQTGLRINEVLQLQQTHLKKKTILISEDIAHDNTQRSLPLPNTLKHHAPKQQYLFSSKQQPLTQRRFEQICKEVGEFLGIEELTPSVLRATAIYNLSQQLTQEQLLSQTGLSSSTLYTHGFLAQEETTLETTTHTGFNAEELDSENDDQGATEFMYHRSKLRDGGDTDE